MGHRVFSVQAARRAARDENTYLLWISARQAVQFREPGWEPLMPHREGAVLFLHRARERETKLLRDPPGLPPGSDR